MGVGVCFILYTTNERDMIRGWVCLSFLKSVSESITKSEVAMVSFGELGFG